MSFIIISHVEHNSIDWTLDVDLDNTSNEALGAIVRSAMIHSLNSPDYGDLKIRSFITPGMRKQTGNGIQRQFRNETQEEYRARIAAMREGQRESAPRDVQMDPSGRLNFPHE